MKSREGTVVDADDLLDEAKNTLYASTWHPMKSDDRHGQVRV